MLSNGFSTSVNGVGILLQDNIVGLRTINWTMFGCGDSAIQCNGTSLTPVSNILLESIVTSACSFLSTSSTVIGVNFGNDVYMRNCTINSGGNGTTPLSIVRVANSGGFLFENSSLTDNQASELVGIDLISSASCLCQNIFLTTNNATTGDCTGISLSSNSSYNTIENFKILAASAPSGANYGINLQSGSAANYMSGCQITNLLGINVYGIIFTGTGSPSNTIHNTIINSSVIRGTATTGEMVGVEINGADQSTVQNCLITDNNSQFGIAAGLRFNVAAGGTDWNINNNNITRNNGVDTGNSYGILQQTGSDNLFLQNFAYNNGMTSGNQLNGVPSGSVLAVNSTNLTTALSPWANLTIIP